MSIATDILLWSSSHCFSVSFFLPLDTNGLRGESSCRPEPLRKPPYEPSRVDIQFYYNFTKIYTDIPLELPKADQVLLLQGFNDVLSPKRDDGKRFSSTSENLKNGSPDQKSRCRTCAQACYSPFKPNEPPVFTRQMNKLPWKFQSRPTLFQNENKTKVEYQGIALSYPSRLQNIWQ